MAQSPDAGASVQPSSTITGADLMLAATALERGLQLAIRNVRAFIPTRGAVVNPFSPESPPAAPPPPPR